MKRTLGIVVMFLIAAVLLWIYWTTRLPPGVESKGADQGWSSWITLLGGIISLVTGIVNLVLKIIETRAKLTGARAQNP